MAKRNIIARIQRWVDSKPGQMVLNYAYSWGAAVVVLGALFKITHITGADLMLLIGMGTEVVVFFLAGFERPYEKDDKDEKAPTGGSGVATVQPVVQTIPVGAAREPIDAAQLAGAIASSPIMNSPQFTGMCPEMQEATQNYVDQLNELTETLKKVAEQSARLTRDSEEMENMNRTLTGINRFYEMQLRSVSVQSATVDDVNTQTKRLADQLEELNHVYARMVEALKVNMNASKSE